MRFVTAAVPLFLLLCFTTPVFAVEQKPEIIVDRMVVKFVRGITNVATCVLELPKQTYRSIRDRGAAGIIIGPAKGTVMTFYRAFIGTAETVFFLVPAPGYYDPMIDPEFVWNEWGSSRVEDITALEPEQTPEAAEKKVESPPAAPAVEEKKVEPPPAAPAAEEKKVEPLAAAPAVEEKKVEPASPAPAVEEQKAAPAPAAGAAAPPDAQK